MKKSILILLFMVSNFLISQNKIIAIDTIINIENTKKDVLYDRMHSHLTKYLKTQKQEEYIFKAEDKESGIIKIYRKFPHTTKTFVGSAVLNDNVNYSYELYFKDDKIRLVVDGFTHPYLGVSTTEKPYPEECYKKGSGKKWFTKVYKEFVDNTISYRELIIKDTKNAVLKKDISEEDW